MRVRCGHNQNGEFINDGPCTSLATMMLAFSVHGDEKMGLAFRCMNNDHRQLARDEHPDATEYRIRMVLDVGQS